jgi:hypothetical protein
MEWDLTLGAHGCIRRKCTRCATARIDQEKPGQLLNRTKMETWIRWPAASNDLTAWIRLPGHTETNNEGSIRLLAWTELGQELP